jgi:hypothetical protein
LENAKISISPLLLKGFHKKLKAKLPEEPSSGKFSPVRMRKGVAKITQLSTQTKNQIFPS